MVLVRNSVHATGLVGLAGFSSQGPTRSAQAGVSEGSTHVTQGGAKVGWGECGEAEVSTSTAQGEPSESPTTPVMHTYI